MSPAQELEQAVEKYFQEGKITAQQKARFEGAIREYNAQYEKGLDIINDDSQRAPGVNNMSKEEAIEKLNNFQARRYERLKGQLDQAVLKQGEEQQRDFERLIEDIARSQEAGKY